MELNLLDGEFTVCKIADPALAPIRERFCFLGRTDEENSLACRTEALPAEGILAREDGWRCFRVEGTLDFSLVGILAEISGILAREGISIFAVSTYQTDYLFIKREALPKAIQALTGSGYLWKNGK